MMMGAAYGYFLDYCRRLFRVAPYQQAKPDRHVNSDWLCQSLPPASQLRPGLYPAN